MPGVGLRRPTLSVLSRQRAHKSPPHLSPSRKVCLGHPCGPFSFSIGAKKTQVARALGPQCSQRDADRDEHTSLGRLSHHQGNSVESTSHLIVPHYFLPLPPALPPHTHTTEKTTQLPSQPIWVWTQGEHNASYWVAGLNLALTELFRDGINL